MAGDEIIQPTHLNIQIEPDKRAGVWANFAVVSHSPHEFTLDFIRLELGNVSAEGTVEGIVVARVSVSPLFITQLIEALDVNWQKYAERALPPEGRPEE